MSTIVATGVTRHFGNVVAVEDVDITVAEGEVVGLLGANGAGKTTLIRMLLGLLKPTAGTVRMFGQRLGLEQRRRIGYVPQDLGLYVDLTASENLAFRADVFGVAERAVQSLPDGSQDRLVGALSLGEQRLTAFEAATQHDPELFVLDEPTSGVSPLARSELWDLIRRRAEAGAAVLVSTHYMEEAEQADRLVVMAAGRIVAEGTVDDVVAGRTTVEVRTDRWADAFSTLDHDQRRISLAGTTVRVLAEPVDEIRQELTSAAIESECRLVPATLDETMVVLDQ